MARKTREKSFSRCTQNDWLKQKNPEENKNKSQKQRITLATHRSSPLSVVIQLGRKRIFSRMTLKHFKVFLRRAISVEINGNKNRADISTHTSTNKLSSPTLTLVVVFSPCYRVVRRQSNRKAREKSSLEEYLYTTTSGENHVKKKDHPRRTRCVVKYYNIYNRITRAGAKIIRLFLPSIEKSERILFDCLTTVPLLHLILSFSPFRAVNFLFYSRSVSLYAVTDPRCVHRYIHGMPRRCGR